MGASQSARRPAQHPESCDSDPARPRSSSYSRASRFKLQGKRSFAITPATFSEDGACDMVGRRRSVFRLRPRIISRADYSVCSRLADRLWTSHEKVDPVRARRPARSFLKFSNTHVRCDGKGRRPRESLGAHALMPLTNWCAFRHET